MPRSFLIRKKTTITTTLEDVIEKTISRKRKVEEKYVTDRSTSDVNHNDKCGDVIDSSSLLTFPMNCINISLSPSATTTTTSSPPLTSTMRVVKGIWSPLQDLEGRAAARLWNMSSSRPSSLSTLEARDIIMRSGENIVAPFTPHVSDRGVNYTQHGTDRGSTHQNFSSTVVTSTLKRQETADNNGNINTKKFIFSDPFKLQPPTFSLSDPITLRNPSHHSPLTTHHYSPTTHHSPPTTHHSPRTTHSITPASSPYNSFPVRYATEALDLLLPYIQETISLQGGRQGGLYSSIISHDSSPPHSIFSSQPSSDNRPGRIYPSIITSHQYLPGRGTDVFNQGDQYLQGRGTDVFNEGHAAGDFSSSLLMSLTVGGRRRSMSGDYNVKSCCIVDSMSESGRSNETGSRSVTSSSSHHPGPRRSNSFQEGITVGYTYDAFFISDGRARRRQKALLAAAAVAAASDGSGTDSRATLLDPATRALALTASSQQRYKCGECGKHYATSSNLSRHKQTHRSLESQQAKQCPHCRKVYVSMPALSMHILTHDLKYRCTVCSKAFSRPWLLQGHLRSHSGEKPYGCTHCGRAFADRSNLRAHMQTHSAYKMYTCQRCNKSFALKAYLNKHLESACFKDDEENSCSSMTSIWSV